MELRFAAARSTVDIDLTIERFPQAEGDGDGVRDLLQQAALPDLGDWFVFTIGAAQMDLDAAPCGGARYPIEARMDQRIFSRFHLDAGIGDAVMQPVDPIACRDWLAFAGVARTITRALAKEQQFAEKLHAYTVPRVTSNSRVKDLVDLALLIGSGQLEPTRVVEALRLTFARRQTHALPQTLANPPAEWEIPFRASAVECRLVPDIRAAFAQLEDFFARLDVP